MGDDIANWGEESSDAPSMGAPGPANFKISITILLIGVMLMFFTAPRMEMDQFGTMQFSEETSFFKFSVYVAIYLVVFIIILVLEAKNFRNKLDSRRL